MDINNFQRLSGQQGASFEKNCIEALKYAGWRIVDRRVQLKSVEVDIIATNKQEISFYITSKGSVRGPRAGFRRTDTVKKAVAEAYFMIAEGREPVLIMASPLPRATDGRTKEMIIKLERRLVFDIINPYDDGKRLTWLFNATEKDLEKDLIKNPSLWDMICDRLGC